ncbi:MAG: BCCT family transporter [Spirochaetota bacterium]
MESNEQQPRTGIRRFFDIHAPVFWPTVILLALFVGLVLASGDQLEQTFANIQNWISDNFGWFLIAAVNFFLIAVIYFAFSRFGDIRLGGRTAVPQFSRMAWFSMLFSAGMGIGLLFWSVAEPIYHFTEPPITRAGTQEAAQEAMNFTFLHWGLHAWAIYTLVGLALAFFAFNRNMPLAFRSVFYPMIGKRVYGWAGNIIDVLAVLATLFGLATSLGFGVQQVGAGLAHLFGIPNTLPVRILLIALITGAATGSVVLGLDRGVKRLSELNIRLAGVLLAFLLVLGPTVFIISSYIQNIGGYLNDFFHLSFWAESYQASTWQNNWTVFYWSWWISWSPFVGMFIARISRGRTIKEYVLSVLIVPTILTFFWITAFGGSALSLELQGVADIAAGIKEEVATSIYVLFEQFPFAAVTNFAAVALVISFFITSSDSGSLVVDAFTSGGKLNSPVAQRVFWASMEGLVAAILLIGGGLQALQTASIITGLPFAIILMLMCFSLYKGLNKEYEALQARKETKERESYRELIQKTVGNSQTEDDMHKGDDHDNHTS